jgi:hypothetical protein
MNTVVPGGVNTFLMNQGQVKHLTPIFIPSPKKADVTKCTNNCTIALFPHANKILLQVFKKQLQSHIGHEKPKEQAGLRKGHGERDEIANVSESWTVQRGTKKCHSLL